MSMNLPHRRGLSKVDLRTSSHSPPPASENTNVQRQQMSIRALEKIRSMAGRVCVVAISKVLIRVLIVNVRY